MRIQVWQRKKALLWPLGFWAGYLIFLDTGSHWDTITVQAPQPPLPQAYLVPVRPTGRKWSRRLYQGRHGTSIIAASLGRYSWGKSSWGRGCRSEKSFACLQVSVEATPYRISCATLIVLNSPCLFSHLQRQKVISALSLQAYHKHLVG